MNAIEFAKLVETKCLTAAGLERAKSLVELTRETSENYPDVVAALAEANARWESEAPVREARELLRQAGWEKSKYDDAVWINRRTKSKRSLVEAIKESNLAG